MKKQLLLGLAAMLLPWTAWAEAHQGQFTVTGVNETYVYDGAKNLTPTVEAYSTTLTEGTHYIISYTLNGEPVTEVKNVGSYEMTIAGVAGEIYENLDPTTIAFEITKKEVTGLTFTTTAVSREYDGTDNDASVLPQLVLGATGLVGTEADKAEELANFLKCLKVVRQSGEEGTDANGNYHVSVQGYPKGDATGSNYYFPEQDAGNWVRMNITPIKLTASLNWNRQYNGKPLGMSGLNTRVTFDKVLVGDKEQVNASLSYSGTKNLIDADEYTLDLALTGDKAKNYTLAENTVVAEVTKVPLTITLNDGAEDKLTKAYDGNADDIVVTEHFTIVAKPTDSDNNIFDTEKESLALAVLAEISSKGETAGAAGTYAVGLYQKETKEGKETFKEAELKNYSYEFASEDYAYVITGKKLEKETVTYSENKELLVYQGKAFEIEEGFVTVQDGVTTLVEGTDYELILTTTYPTTEGAEATDAADRFTVTVKGIGNYAGTEITSDEFTIAKATLTIEPKKNEAGEYVHASKTYGEKDPEDFMSLYKIDGLKGQDKAETIGLTMDRAKENLTGVENYEYVGAYPVRLYKDNVQIKKIDGEYDTAFKNYKIEYDVNAEKIDTKFYIEPKDLHYHIANAEYTYSYVQDSQKFTVESGDLVNNEELGLKDEISGIFTVEPNVVLDLKDGQNGKDAGVYALKVDNADEVTAANYNPLYEEDMKLDGKYTVKAAPLTIKALDQEIVYLSEDKANLTLDETHTSVNAASAKDANIWFNGIQYAWEWKAMIQKLGELVIDTEVEDYTKKVGEHKITFAENAKETLAAAYPNYEITLTDGILTVKGLDKITLDRDAVDNEEEGTESVATTLAAYNGAENMTVILGGNRDLKADYWYTLVLPFETSVREISNAFGYAVVNVPNENNTDAGVVSFKLKVDAEKIPANTLILIKTDEAINLQDQIEKEEAVKFGGKTIDYNPEYYTSDAAGNEYHGVYENTELQEDGYWYLNGGKFYNAGAYYRAYKVPVSISALGGYVYAVAGAAARILVEEPDGSTTSINTITGETTNSADSWYSVDGMKLNAQPTQKGVYINNGKKVVIK